jgi:hypothetical protein
VRVVPDGCDREEALRIGARTLRFFVEAITHWATPNAAAPARDTDILDNVMCLIHIGTLTQDRQLNTIPIWGKRVIPRFKGHELSADDTKRVRSRQHSIPISRVRSM